MSHFSAAPASPFSRYLRGFAGFAAATIAVTVVAGILLGLVFHAPNDPAAIRAGAIMAVGIQLSAFRATRRLAARNILAGIVAGAGMRLIGLVVFGLLVQTALGLPLATALISLVVFYLPSMWMEPLFLRS